MAVFPIARRALARPAKPWWLLVVAVAIALGALSSYATLELRTFGAGQTGLAASDAHLDAPVGLTHSHELTFVGEDHAPVAGAPSEYVAEVASATVVTSGAPASPAEAGTLLTTAPAGPVERWAATGVIIETEGQDLDDASLAILDVALGALPPEVLGNLGNPDLGPLYILVNLHGRVRSGDQPYRGPANFFSTNDASNELVLYPQQSVFTVVHELGHAYNLRHIAGGKYAMVLLDPEMRSFLEATGWTISSSDEEIRGAVDHMHVRYSYGGSFHWPRLSNDDPLEDFANSFAMYFLDPNGLKRASPERYEWMLGRFGN